MPELPTGTVTFLFTDIEGSTRLLHELGDAYADTLAEHRRVLREAFERHGGVEVDTQGDAFFVAFARASDALATAREAQEALATGPVRVRIGVHTGEPLVTEEGYVGVDVHRASRIAAAGHGGQTLLSQPTRDLLADETLRGLGEHRLKDLSAPERIYQLGDGDFPPLKTLYQTNLPAQPSPLIGRDREITAVLALLSAHRLVTLTGAGGTGKTRLALQVAAESAEDFPDGVWFVSLAPLREPALVEQTIAVVLGVKEPQTVAEHLRSKCALLVLDNFEHLRSAATGISELLREAPQLKVLVTTRASLRVSGEHEYPLLPLADEEAVELFTERARAASPSFEPDAHVSAICRRVDNLPLAIELAAARVKLLPPVMLLERLAQRLPLLGGGTKDVPERQRTLEAAIGWSHDLLDEPEKKLFAQLAVFVGSFDLEGAEAVCDAELDTLGSLVDQSLLRRTDRGRLFQLETIREFALRQLDEDPDAEHVRRRHCERFVALAEEARPHLTGPAQRESIERLDLDVDNLRAALDWASRADPSLGSRLLAAAWRYWYARGHLAEGRRLLDRALDAGASQPAELRRLLHAGTVFAHRQGDVAAGARFARARLEAARTAGDPSEIAGALTGLGLIDLLAGDVDAAVAHHEEGVLFARDAGGGWNLGVALVNLADVLTLRGERERAATLLDESIAVLDEVGDDRSVAAALASRGEVELDAGRHGDAVRFLVQSVERARPLVEREILSWCLEDLAVVAAAEGRGEDAARLLGAAERQREEIGAALQPTQEARHRKTLDAVEARLDAAIRSAAWAEGAALDPADAAELAIRGGRLAA